MKHFGNCNPEEFMKQAMKLREPFSEWLNEVGVREIRARRPEGFDDLKPEEKQKVASQIATDNMGEILTIALEEHYDLTVQVMCIATFTEPKDFNTHTMVEYLTAITEMIANNQVRGFFSLYLAPMMKNSLKG